MAATATGNEAMSAIAQEALDLTQKTYQLEPVPIDNLSDDEFQYEDLSIDDVSESDGDEDLEKAIRNINETSLTVAEPSTKAPKIQSKLERRPEVIDDFIRNFLASKGLSQTLDSFQNEWYELKLRGVLSNEDLTPVPDVYQQNQALNDTIQKLRADLKDSTEIANKARSTYDRLRKERDFHKMHHKRVVQEKNKLLADIKRLKKHYESYEPTLLQLQNKYELAMKEKMLTKLERDRLSGKIETLEQALKKVDISPKTPAPVTEKQPIVKVVEPQTKLPPVSPTKKSIKDNSLPLEDRFNPYSNAELPAAHMESYKNIGSIKAHDMAVSSVKFHPRKMILATVSDDKTWKLWSFPSGELIMSGSGHKDWIGNCDFHPKGSLLATASGDATIKIWDFSKGQATYTLSDHSQAVWSCEFHDLGDYLVSGSMDHTAKLWDVRNGKCRQTLRGHADSINAVAFQPFTNNVMTCSGDKTLSLWDVRTGLCSLTLFGHTSAVNHVAFSIKGNLVASCDAAGVVKFWDLRNVSESESVTTGPHSVNKLSFDPSGNVLALASNDGSCKLLNTKDTSKTKEFVAHDEPVQDVLFERSAEYLVTAGSDGVVKLWS